MPFLGAARAKLVWGLELALGLELYACAVLALHARGLRATPLLASPGLVIPALVIPPVFYVLVGLVSVRPLSPWRLMAAVGAMCGVHAVLVVATGALFVIPDLVDYGAAVGFSLWGSPAVTMLQLTAAPLVLARLRPLLVGPRATPRRGTRPTSAQPTASRPPAVTAPSAPRPPSEAVVASATVAPAVREPAGSPAPARHPPAVISRDATPFPVAAGAAPRAVVEPAAPRPAAAPTEPMIRVSFSRIADQLPVEMFVRGQKGLNDTLRPGVSLLVPRRLLLPHLADGVAPVKWAVIADQFPRDELKLTHEEIERRLPDGVLRLPLDEVVSQIPADLRAPSTRAAVLEPDAPAAAVPEGAASADGGPQSLATRPPVAPMEPVALEPVALQLGALEPLALDPAALKSTLLEAAKTAEVEAAEAETIDIGPAETMPETDEADAEAPASQVLELEAPEITLQALAAPLLARLEAVDVAEPELSGPPDPPRAKPRIDTAASRGRTDEARRIATLLAPLMNGLEIGERANDGTPLVTVVAPSLSEDAVVATAVRVVPLLADGRLSEPVSQATLTATAATIVLTPFESPAGETLLVAAVASRASLAWLERLSRSAAGEPRGSAANGALAPEGPREDDELRVTVVPPSVREVASSITAFGPVTPTVLRDVVGLFRICLFLPGSISPQPLAQLARDLFGALDGAEVGRVASVALRLGTYRLVMRAVEASSGRTTILVGGGPIARPGLARIELDRAAERLGTLGRG